MFEWAPADEGAPILQPATGRLPSGVTQGGSRFASAPARSRVALTDKNSDPYSGKSI